MLDLEEGNTESNHRLLNSLPSEPSEAIEDDEKMESRTIPVWLALFICISWICICSGLFCLWETRWSYFTSLYFFFISLSTIGLGDVVPDHPHMLILMFWLVIIGLSIVSMLLGVIQIKFEEWLYHLMIRMQKEYQRALACGDPVKRNEILQRLMANEPWYIRNMAPHLLTEKQTAQLDTQEPDLAHPTDLVEAMSLIIVWCLGPFSVDGGSWYSWLYEIRPLLACD
ncbi:TWiK family of potassium channels protein 18 [Dirofilaria immitis]|nr:TWiK family of potassium channels protein 18 [Dirofilaria immitis]